MVPSSLLLHEGVHDFIHFFVETFLDAFNIFGEGHARKIKHRFAFAVFV